MTRVILFILSLALFGIAAQASWFGWGIVSSDTGVGSIRAGSAGIGNQRRLRVK